LHSSSPNDSMPRSSGALPTARDVLTAQSMSCNNGVQSVIPRTQSKAHKWGSFEVTTKALNSATFDEREEIQSQSYANGCFRGMVRVRAGFQGSSDDR
jgi:hypothetical protein